MFTREREDHQVTLDLKENVVLQDQLDALEEMAVMALQVDRENQETEEKLVFKDYLEVKD